MRVEVPLRWGDLDAQGHVNNARYLDYLQDARADFLYALHIEGLLHDGFTVVSNQIEYRAPVFFSDDPLDVDIEVAALDDDIVLLAYELFQRDQVVCVARTSLSGYDVAARRRRPLPAHVREVFARLLHPVEPLRDIAWHDLNDHAKVSQMRVRWSDLDSYGHVNNAIIFDYVQEGRITFTAAPLRGMDDSPDAEYLWFLARQDASYLNPIVFRKDPYTVRTGVARIGRTSVTFSSQVDDPRTGVVCARAAAVAVFADAKGRPTPLTDTIRAGLEQYSLGD
ncbi:MAG: thioesterase family protein [Propionibacteriaceae bacterium]|nr:thioesterase family protein [Propionibacteriaceae bacterium]